MYNNGSTHRYPNKMKTKYILTTKCVSSISDFHKILILDVRFQSLDIQMFDIRTPIAHTP